MHGGLFAVLLDEVMETPANFQSGEYIYKFFFSTPHPDVPTEHDRLTPLIPSTPANGVYTVRFTTNYRRPIKTPQVVLSRAVSSRRRARSCTFAGRLRTRTLRRTEIHTSLPPIPPTPLPQKRCILIQMSMRRQYHGRGRGPVDLHAPECWAESAVRDRCLPLLACRLFA
jgi:hypothetical protein